MLNQMCMINTCKATKKQRIKQQSNHHPNTCKRTEKKQKSSINSAMVDAYRQYCHNTATTLPQHCYDGLTVRHSVAEQRRERSKNVVATLQCPRTAHSALPALLALPARPARFGLSSAPCRQCRPPNDGGWMICIPTWCGQPPLFM